MCGIVSYIGTASAAPILYDGLKRLEYRGYDSAGIALVNGGVKLAKRVGRVAELDDTGILEDEVAHVGIAHTRWATHGEPTELNAHPHQDCSGRFYVVHNGIIENYRELREKLRDSGHEFVSETDTEVLAHLIEQKVADGEMEFGEAVRLALLDVQGAYGIAVIDRDRPEQVVVAKQGSPLLLGVGDGEMLVASDASAIVRRTRQVVYLDDGELAEVEADGYRILQLRQRAEVKKTPVELEISADAIEKDGFDHFMLKEIMQQPEVMRDTMRGRLQVEEGLAHLGGLMQVEERLREIDRLIIVSCGTARLAGLVGEYLIEEIGGISVEVDFASEFRYRNPRIDERTACLFISQSGETADTIAALEEAKRKGALTLGVVNVVGSTIARMTDAGVYTHAGPEISVASTKAFLAQMTVMAVLALQFGRARDLSIGEGREFAADLAGMPEMIAKVLESRDAVRQVAEKYVDASNMLFLGRKYQYPIAEEGALKLKELSYIHAEGYPTGEMKHGPIALIDENMPCVVLVPQDEVYDKVVSGIEEIRARGGKVIAIATEGDDSIEELADDVIWVPKVRGALQSFLTVIPLQLFAYYVAAAKKLDVDKPRNLAKSVTVE